MKKLSTVSAAALVILVLFGAGCGSTEREETPPTVTPTMTPSDARPSPSAAPEWLAAGATNRVVDITGDPNAFLGKTVTLVAEIDDVYGPRAFTLDANGDDSSGANGDDLDLLALVPKVGGFPSVDHHWEGGKARVTGVVQRMEPKYIEREIGWVLPADLESDFRGKPTLIVRSVERLRD